MVARDFQAALDNDDIENIVLKIDSPGGLTAYALPDKKNAIGAFDTMDISSIIKSVQALSSEIDLEKLLEKIIMIATQNAGAQKAILLLKNSKDNHLYIEASADIFHENKETKVLESIPLEKSDMLSTGIVNYVAKTGENVFLDNACGE